MLPSSSCERSCKNASRTILYIPPSPPSTLVLYFPDYLHARPSQCLQGQIYNLPHRYNLQGTIIKTEFQYTVVVNIHRVYMCKNSFNGCWADKFIVFRPFTLSCSASRKQNLLVRGCVHSFRYNL